jgi:hypothetical protein
MTMRARTLRKLWLVAAAAALALAAAGCGGTTTSAVGGGGDAASIVPASAPVYVSVNTDLSSGQWTKVDALLSKFPGKQALLDGLRRSFESTSHVPWADLKPALGDVLDVALLDLEQPTWALLLQPTDKAAVDALVKRSNASSTPADRIYVGASGGWTLVSDSAASVHAFEQAAASGAKLADDPTFQEATGGLAGEALAKVYVNGPKVAATLKQALGVGVSALAGPGRLRWAAAEVVAQDDGVKLDGRVKSEGGKPGAAYRPELIRDVPAGALVYLSFDGSGGSGIAGGLKQSFGALPGAARATAQILDRLGPIFAHEGALYVRAGGAAIPEITLLAVPDDPQQGVAAIDELVAKLGGGGLKPKPAQIAGVDARELDLGRFSLYYGVVGTKLVVTDARSAFQTVEEGGPSLADDPTFKAARSQAGMPEETGGFLYVNLKDSLPLVESLAQLAGSKLPAQLSENLKPLRTFIAYTGKDGASVSTFTAFLGVN